MHPHVYPPVFRFPQGCLLGSPGVPRWLSACRIRNPSRKMTFPPLVIDLLLEGMNAFEPSGVLTESILSQALACFTRLFDSP